MWIFTTRGFYSAVQHRDDPTRILVRARNKADIDALKEYLPDAKPWQEQFSDYAWRVEVPASEWAKALALMGLDVDYDNFKSAVLHRQGAARHSVYTKIWGALLGIETKGPGRRSKTARGRRRFAARVGFGEKGKS